MTLQISIGNNKQSVYDFKVLEYSIRQRASISVDIRPVPDHSALLTRSWEITQTTPFSFTRFLTPYMWEYKGISMYMDPDMLCLCDIKELADMYDPQYAIQVVKHNYIPYSHTKYVGQQQQTQYAYQRKNWSSLIIFNNERCKQIYTPETIETLSGIMLHQFTNVEDNMIGSIPKEYNYIVGEPNQAETGKIIHFSNGMPYVPYYSTCEYATNWFEEFGRTIASNS